MSFDIGLNQPLFTCSYLLLFKYQNPLYNSTHCVNTYEFVKNTKIISTGPVSQIINVKCTRTLNLLMKIRDSHILSLKIIKGINWCETMSVEESKKKTEK